MKEYIKNNRSEEIKKSNIYKNKDNYFLASVCDNLRILNKKDNTYYNENGSLKKSGYILQCKIPGDDKLYDIFVVSIHSSQINYSNKEDCGYSYLIVEGKIMTDDGELKENEEYFVVENKYLNNTIVQIVQGVRLSNFKKTMRISVTGKIYKKGDYTIIKGIEEKDKSFEYQKIINNKKSQNSKYVLEGNEEYFIAFKANNPRLNNIENKSLNNYGNLRLMGCRLSNLEKPLGVSVTSIIHHEEEYAIVKGRVNEVINV